MFCVCPRMIANQNAFLLCNVKLVFNMIKVHLILFAF